MADTSRQAMAVQYGDDRNLAARASIYRFRRSGPSLLDWALDLAELDGDERVVDIGCGNGSYLSTLLGDRGHTGPIAGFDLSPGMAAAASARSGAPVAVADAQALPLRTDAVDVALCMHVLYHVPDQATAVAELRRVVRPGGVALFVTNAADHVREIDDLVAGVAGVRPARSMGAFKMEHGAAVLGTAFESVVPHRLAGALDVTDADAVVGYVTSVRGLYDGVEEARYAAAAQEIGRRVDDAIDSDGSFTVTTSTGCFVCR